MCVGGGGEGNEALLFLESKVSLFLSPDIGVTKELADEEELMVVINMSVLSAVVHLPWGLVIIQLSDHRPVT